MGASAPETVSRAVARGTVTEAEVVAGRVAVRDLSRSNTVRVVERDGEPVVYVKQRGGASGLDGDDAVAAEATVLRALEPFDRVPRLLGVDADAVWIAPVRGRLLSHVAGTPAGLRGVCEAWGAALARLHAWPCPADGAPAAVVPWALTPDDLPASVRSVRGTRTDEILALLRDDTVLRAAADRARAAWCTSAFTHGDLSAANLLVTTDPVARADEGGPDDVTVDVAFIDLELGGRGDPGWDLVTVHGTLRLVAPTWGLDAAEAVAVFDVAYRDAGGCALPGADLERLRSLTTAWQVAARAVVAAYGTDPAGGTRSGRSAAELDADVATTVSALLDRARGAVPA